MYMLEMETRKVPKEKDPYLPDSAVSAWTRCLLGAPAEGKVCREMKPEEMGHGWWVLGRVAHLIN